MSHLSVREELRRLRSGVAALGVSTASVEHARPPAGPSDAESGDDQRTFESANEKHDAESAGGFREHVRKNAPGWLVSAATHALLLLALGLTALSAQHTATWLGVEIADSPTDPGGEGLEVSPAEMGGLDSDSGDTFDPSAVEAVASLAPLRAMPLAAPRLELGEVAPAPPSIADEVGAMVGNGRDLALKPRGNGTGNGTGNGSGNGSGGPGSGSGGGLGSGSGDGAGSGTGGGRGNDYAIFYGTEARGKRFVYVVDSSESMTGLRFEKACRELMSSVVGLDSRQSFYVIFFNTGEFPQYYPLVDNFLSTAGGQSVDKLGTWMRNVRPMGGTNPAPALKRALQLEPDAVFLLSDGEFDIGPTMYVLRNFNSKRTVVHTIAFGSLAGEPMLYQIATFTGGTYRFVPVLP